jgi:hypothetical protein
MPQAWPFANRPQEWLCLLPGVRCALVEPGFAILTHLNGPPLVVDLVTQDAWILDVQ